MTTHQRIGIAGLLVVFAAVAEITSCRTHDSRGGGAVGDADQNRLCGRVVGEDGVPIAGATVTVSHRPWSILSVDRANLGEETEQTRTAQDGTFSLRVGPVGLLDLRAKKDGLASVLRPNCTGGQRVNIVLGRAVTLIIVVRDVHHQPVVGAHVRLSRRRVEFAGEPGLLVQGLSGADGTCRFEDMPASMHGVVLEVQHPDVGSYEDANFQLPARGEHRVEVVFGSSRVVRGQVLDKRSRKAIPGARVSASSTMDASVLTDEAGCYTLATSNTAWSVWADASGHGSSSARIGTADRVQLELERGSCIRGRIVSARSTPVTGAYLTAVGDVTQPWRHAVSGMDGRFELTDLRHNDPHRLIVTAPGHGRAVFDLDPLATPGCSRSIGDLPLPPARQLMGRVLLPDGSPATRAVLHLSSRPAGPGYTNLRAEGGPLATAPRRKSWTGSMGRFRFTAVAPGVHDITASIPGRHSVSASIEIQTEDPAPITLRFPPGRVFVVRVLDDHEEPVVRVNVTVSMKNRSWLNCFTDAKGEAVFHVDSPVVAVQARESVHSPDRCFIASSASTVEEGAQQALLHVRRGRWSSGVVRLPDGTPVPSAEVRATEGRIDLSQDATSGQLLQANESGWFQVMIPLGSRVSLELKDAMLAGSGDALPRPLRGRLDGVEPGQRELVLTAQLVPLDRTLTVAVYDPDRQPVPSATVHASYAPLRRNALPDRTTGLSGIVTFADLADAQVDLRTELSQDHPSRGEWIAPRLSVIPDGQVVGLFFRRGERTSGQVTDEKTRPLPGASIQVYDADHSLIASQQTDHQGRFSFAIDPEAPRPLYVLVWHRGAARVVREFRDENFSPGENLQLRALPPK